jgi:uncharacterized protein (DUF924 family)
MNPDVNHLLSFWYDRPSIEWFVPPPGFDKECKDKFGHLIHQARNNELDHWADEPKGTLALMILLDQFSRNVFRNTPEMYEADPKAFDIATKSIAKGFDRQVSSLQALTLYLPLMHNENLLSQVAALALLENLTLRSEEGSEERKMMENGMSSAKGHLEIIQRFGRFPSRNKILGRENTKEEEEYLRENPEGFARPPPLPKS